MNQICILLFGLTAVLFSQVENVKLRKWSPVLGLCSQPFWLFESFSNKLYGMVAISTLYTFVWAWGVYTYWIKPHRNTEH